jgi:UDP-3-O-[3-hydroxymyristoyl] glucosamine N-acyltransferase
MRLPSPHTVQELLAVLNREWPSAEGRLAAESNSKAVVHGINVIHKVEAGDLTYADHPKYAARTLASPAACVLLPHPMDGTDVLPADLRPISPTDRPTARPAVLYVHDPFSAFNILLAHFSPAMPMTLAVHPSAVIGEGSILEHGVVVGANVVIGRDCVVHAGAVLYPRTVLGDRVRIQAGAVLGGDAYFFRTRDRQDGKRYDKMRTTGRVVIGNDVEIGANSTVDAGATGDTVIGNGTKLDNLVHIGHGAVIGEDCLLAAQVGVGGKTIIGNRCIFWGQVGISKDLTIGDDTIAYAQSGIKNSLPGGKVWFGSPVREAREKMKELAASKDLYAMWRSWEKT